MDKLSVAVMQPYFMPYAGYYRLMAATDVFVIYDCVQFPKGGWVHRNRLPATDGELKWLTLPIQRPSLGATIESLTFLSDAKQVLRERLAAFPEVLAGMQTSPLLAPSLEPDGRAVDYLAAQLEAVSRHLGFTTRFVRASSLSPSPAKDAQQRVIEMVQKLDGAVYVNAPGGRALYQNETFAQAGVELRFLVDHPGPNTSMLHRLINEDTAALRDEIMGATRYG